jgi:hypothetical protein
MDRDASELDYRQTVNRSRIASSSRRVEMSVYVVRASVRLSTANPAACAASKLTLRKARGKERTQAYISRTFIRIDEGQTTR